MSKSLPNAHTPGKRNKKQDKEEETRGSSSSHKLDPKVPIAYGAFCADCGGSLGSYFSQRDATNAENLHQQRKHANSPHKRTTSGEAQRKRNKHGEK